jgi:hypothetical protein
MGLQVIYEVYKVVNWANQKVGLGHGNSHFINPFTASCENAMTLSVPGVPASCEKFPHSSQLNFLSTESILNQFSVFLKTLNAICVCLQYKHPRSMKRVIRSDKPVTLLLLFWSHKCDIGAEPRSRIIASSAVEGLNLLMHLSCCNMHTYQAMQSCTSDLSYGVFLGIEELKINQSINQSINQPINHDMNQSWL